jgi:fatty acid-binding protein DegV
MVRQQETALHRKWNVALVTVSICDLPKELIDYYQIHVFPVSINFGDQ